MNPVVVRWSQAAGRISLIWLILLAGASGASLAPVGWPLLLIGLGMAVTVLAASWRCAQPDRAGWWALAGALAMFALTAYLSVSAHDPSVTTSDLLYLVAYLLAYIGLWRLLRRAAGHGDVADIVVLVPALAIVLAAIVARWSGAVQSDEALTGLYPLADLPVAILSVRLVWLRRGLASCLLAVGALGLLASGLVVALAGYLTAPRVVSGLWAVFEVCWGTAAIWAPALDRPGPPTRQAATLQIVLFRVVVLLVPAALMAQALVSGDREDFVLAVACGALALFVIDRLRHTMRARYAGQLDPVTGLGSFAGLRARIDHALANRGDDEIIALFVIDIHDFHAVNNALGFTGGNRVLAQIGRRLSAALGAAPVIARTSADRFAVLLSEHGPDPDLDAYGRRLVHLAGMPLNRRTRRLRLNSCAGYATSAVAASPEELIRDCDLALHAAKRAGPGSCVGFSPDLLSHAAERTRLRADLMRAIDQQQLVLEYQQIVDLRDGLIVGFEALVRWRHPELGQLSPDKFVPLAETSGRIRELGGWVFRQAITDARVLTETAGRLLFIDINVSPHQLYREDFAADAAAVVDSAGLSPAAVVVEVTESGLTGDGPAVISELRKLKAAGMKVAMDDFGTGYSSLAALKDLPCDIIKIDKAFVTGLRPGPRLNFVAGMLSLAEARNVSVIAEGVETPLTRKLLADLGCRLGQGYLFSRPVPLDEAVTQLRAARAARLRDGSRGRGMDGPPAGTTSPGYRHARGIRPRGGPLLFRGTSPGYRADIPAPHGSIPPRNPGPRFTASYHLGYRLTGNGA